MDNWRPIPAPELEALVSSQLSVCSPTQQTAFARYRVQLYPAPFRRADALEQVLVVAELPVGLLYYDDVEEGFEVGAPDSRGILHDCGCNQFELKHALARAGF